MLRRPSLFDPPPEPEPEPEPEAPEWREAPQALFLSWPAARQFAHCAARDEDSVLAAEGDEEILFYGRRAASYRALSLQTKGC